MIYADDIQPAQVTGVAVPKRWLEQYSSLFASSDLSPQVKEPTHHLVAVHPVPLSEVILVAYTEDAYQLSLAQRPAFEDYFFDEQRILRQDSVYHLKAQDLGLPDDHASSVSAHEYRLVMATPVLQGCAKRGHTRFYVISAPPATAANGSADTEPILDDLQEIPSDEEDVDKSEDGFEIDEAFLAGSVLHPVPPHGERAEPSATGDSANADRHRINSSVYIRAAEPLAFARSPVEDDSTIYIPTADLSQVGVLSGDWVCETLRSRDDH